MKGQWKAFVMIIIIGLGFLVCGLNTAAGGIHSLTLTGELQTLGLSASREEVSLTVFGDKLTVSCGKIQAWVQTSIQPIAAYVTDRCRDVIAFGQKVWNQVSRFMLTKPSFSIKTKMIY